MRCWTSIVLLLFLAACGGSASDEPATRSPLIGADSDRLWILARASKVGDGRECKELYLNPDDPRYQGLAQKCDHWSRNYADYLRINGFATVEHLHLQDPAYWRWYLGTREAISACRKALGTLPVNADGQQRAEHARQRSACDPYDDALHNQGVKATELGIRHN